MKNEKGVITLEACVAVLSFLLLMLLISGLFVMFMAQNETAHVTLQTAESLSLDVYSTERLTVENGTVGTTSEYLTEFLTKMFGSPEEKPNYVDNTKWYAGSNADIEKAIKNRFLGYISNGDEKKADELLKNLNIVNGLDGLDFTDSYVEDDTLYIVLKYELEYDFNIWNVGSVDVKQTTCSKLWK